MGAYRSQCDTDPDIALCYAALPLALSGDLATTFDRTNSRTGLLEWLHRSPVIQIRLAGRVNGSLDIVTEAIRFACFSHLLVINAEGRLVLVPLACRKASRNSLAKTPSKLSNTLNAWAAGWPWQVRQGRYST